MPWTAPWQAEPDPAELLTVPLAPVRTVDCPCGPATRHSQHRSSCPWADPFAPPDYALGGAR